MSIAEDEAERVYPTRYWDGTTATRTICRKLTCEAAKRHRLTLRWRPWQNACYGEAARSGMASKATVWRRTKMTHGIMPVRFPASRRNISDRPRKCSKSHGRR